MQKLIYSVLTFVIISSLSFAQMQLQLAAEITGETPQSFVNHDYESNLHLTLPESAVPPAGMKDFVKGMFLLGLLADLSIPFGDEDTGFKHIAGTGFSGHAMASYVVAASWLLYLRGGYISFGTQTTEGGDEFYNFKYEDTYTQIPILLGASYLFATGSAFRPYVGLALGVFIQSYDFKWTESYEGFESITQEQFTWEGDASSTGFGIVPAVGAYYIAGSVMIHLAVEYAFLFSNLPEPDLEDLDLTKVSGIAQEEEESTDEKASYLSFLLGVSIPLGGN